MSIQRRQRIPRVPVAGGGVAAASTGETMGDENRQQLIGRGSRTR